MTTNRPKNKGGAPLGNQNARKHGFYSRVLAPEQQKLLSSMSASGSLEQEIALMRVKIASILFNDPGNTSALVLAMTTLARLMRTDRHIGSREERALKIAGEVVSRLFPANNRS